VADRLNTKSTKSKYKLTPKNNPNYKLAKKVYRHWRNFALSKRWGKSRRLLVLSRSLNIWNRLLLNATQIRWRMIVRSDIHYAYKQYLACWSVWIRMLDKKTVLKDIIKTADSFGKIVDYIIARAKLLHAHFESLLVNARKFKSNRQKRKLQII
jgi:hypothetical protein